ncbi:NucA/NucB deoxyribonuclease domain-containing protein [Paenibacillus sp. FJAT-26967]|uniref:NucA/NucB deoxyribonuclease domain-containing protein n=1 Tax=Paenibacillus sp. FJAT-26967 TaxID=1729690 RepID=UPI000837BD2C|nr:NucA/NucB deoxyribonuclease domain-containing protein [Paenibacillus sp. FJAT-26967]
MKKRKKYSKLLTLFTVVLLAVLYAINPGMFHNEPDTSADIQLFFPSDKYPETAKHIKSAISKGSSKICTIDRKGAEENRRESLAGIATKKNYDRDEWPMAMCAEGGKGADIEYISPKDNRGAGSWIGNQLDKLEDGTRVEIIVK